MTGIYKIIRFFLQESKKFSFSLQAIFHTSVTTCQRMKTSRLFISLYKYIIAGFQIKDLILGAAFIQNFSDLAIVQNAFAGIRVCVCVLIFNAVVKLWKKSVIDKPTLAVFLAVFAGSAFLNLSPILFVILAAVAGILLKNKEVQAK